MIISPSFQLFDEDGLFLKTLAAGHLGRRCYGLASDGAGRVITLKTGGGKTDVIFVDVEDGRVVRTIEMVDIISDPAKSKVRFHKHPSARLII